MGRSTVHYADNATNTILKRLHNKLRPAGTPVQRVEYIIELLLLRIFEVKLKQDREFEQLRKVFTGENEDLLFSALASVPNDQILPLLNARFFPFYARILSEARKVYSGNPKDKVQDQLVLIEEVFGNSNFTNNVNSGNLREVVGLVGELDEQRLLKTDLLGDAIESALSETGGTKDIGLFRTPDHIRQFMVGLVAPTFADLIFDPTAGTGGFLFDGFEYVMESVTREGRWPGPRAHPELTAWFKEHFAKSTAAMPTVEVATDFYRTGVTGIEYLGMIRKMAAINFYIRGLNPANMEQGDSLAMFKKKCQPESKTAILANPPFGAERDQEAYPDVWSEYPKESETTILFVKLMFETLKKTGRCAVVVSEGFMTWDQNSARALRKMLLDEASLKAIISLPQGVFVSKGGQGPKTSILYFEKGGPTRNVWFYKVGNDGYTMGTNRKPVEGCQLVEALEMFDRYVRRGEVPPETRYSFSIPAEWIKALDPRLKEKVRTETRAELMARAEEERKKLFENLNGRLADGKVKPSEMDERLAQHEQLWQARIQNEIGRRIERAHLYSFNLPNYRSTLTPAQIEAWVTRAGDRVKERRTDYLDERYDRVRKAKPEQLDEVLSALDPQNALELDIAREALAHLDAAVLGEHPHLGTLLGIINTVAKLPRVKLADVLLVRQRPVRVEQGQTYRLVTIRLYGKGADLRAEVQGEELKGSSWYAVKTGDLVFSKIDARHGAFATIPPHLDGAIVTGEFPVFEVRSSVCHPGFLLVVLTDARFYSQIDEMVSGASGRRRVSSGRFCDLEIPLPTLDAQSALVGAIERQRAVLRGAELIKNNWAFDIGNLVGAETVRLGDHLVFVSSGSTPLGGEANYVGDGVLFIRSQNVLVGECDFSDAVFITEEIHRSMGRTSVQRFDVFLNITGASIGRSAVMAEDRPANVNQHVAILRPDEKTLNPFFLSCVLNSPALQKAINTAQMGASRQGLNFGQIRELRIPLPPLDVQNDVALRFRALLEATHCLGRIATHASAALAGATNGIWET